MLAQVFEWSDFIFFHFSEESRSNTGTAGGGRQKRPIQQKILKPRNTNPPHYRQRSLANHRALPCNTDDCAVSLSVCVCVCLASSDLSKGFQGKTNTCQNPNAKMQWCNICQQKAVQVRGGEITSGSPRLAAFHRRYWILKCVMDHI